MAIPTTKNEINFYFRLGSADWLLTSFIILQISDF
jgi:hypothetical protein